jgi:hypothetical protein
MKHVGQCGDLGKLSAVSFGVLAFWLGGRPKWSRHAKKLREDIGP